MIRLHVATLVAATGLILLVAGTSGDAAATSASLDPPSSLPTAPSGRYMLTGFWATPGAMLRVGNTIYVGGAFSQIANRTGSAIVVPTSGGAPEPGFPEVAGGSVTASVADGIQGWYLGGSFTNVGGVARPGLAHVRGDGVLDTGLRSGRARGGPRARTRREACSTPAALSMAPPFPWSAPSTQPQAPPSPSASNRRRTRETSSLSSRTRTGVFVAFSAWSRGSSVVAFDASTGRHVWVHSFPFDSSREGPETLALDARRLLVGGDFGDAGNENLEALDFSTGTPTGPSFHVSTRVTSIAVFGIEIYVARYRSKRGSSGLDVINWATGLGRSWGLIRAEQLAASGPMLIVTGRTATEERQGVHARVYSARTGTAKATLKTVSPPLGGAALTLAPQGGRLLVGGTFSSAGGVARANLAAFDVRTGKLLPWRPSVDGVVTGLAAANGKIYIGGYFGHVAGKTRRSLAAVTATGAGAAASVASGPVVLVGCHALRSATAASSSAGPSSPWARSERPGSRSGSPTWRRSRLRGRAHGSGLPRMR